MVQQAREVQRDVFKQLQDALRRDAQLHEQLEPGRIGKDFDDLDAGLQEAMHQVEIARSFWDSWIEERNRGFPGTYEAIRKEDWPVYARQIAKHLATQEPITDTILLRYFDPRTAEKKAAPKQGLLGGVKNILKR